MITKVSKARFKKIAIAFVLLSIAQWYHDGFVICYGADGHIEIERPADKGCCKQNESIVFPDQVAHFDFDHCVDIPIWAQKYIASTSQAPPVHKHGMTLCIDSLLPSPLNWSLRVLLSRDMPPPLSPPLATLKTVVLRI
jgi:hypothetical protein